jgi:ribonuclease III
LTDRLGHPFTDPDLLRRALTHRSAGSKNNERLEFLGDALLNLIVAEALFQRWPRSDEGELTRARAALVREESLARVARRLELGDRLELGPGELRSGGFRRDSILADAVEALIGAVYLDAGFEACRERVLCWLDEEFATLAEGRPAKDAKTRLQEWLQARQQPLPEYRLVSADGEDHEKTFNVLCVVTEPATQAPGAGTSRRLAEQSAAAAALALIEEAH